MKKSRFTESQNFGMLKQADAERICREFKWALPPRVSESALVQNDRRGSPNHR